MQNQPLVSILIPVYNMESFIEEAVDSALNQGYGNCEIIIVDNHSTDNTWKVLSKYQSHPNIVVYKNASNIGMVRNWNACLSYAKGEYIKFLNADDVLDADAISKYVHILQEFPTVSLVTASYTTFGTEHKTYVPPVAFGLLKGKEALVKSIESHNWIGSPTQVMFKRSDLSIGHFNIASNFWPDWELWLKLLLIGDLYIIEESLTKYRIHANQISGDFNHGKSRIQTLIFLKCLTRAEPFSFCLPILLDTIKRKQYWVYEYGMSQLRRGNIRASRVLIKASGSSYISLFLFKYLYEKIQGNVFNKK
ncbi:glycosyltransferase [uncultured Cytophaga sp.]|uniref:glycosyltransferase family 2 protein n=1 Tax=uncultured Cytophaga sp. TaxID=160238 RepID=UPI00261E7DA4|nr:glycosyltransferase [uncultured Cytophaga sp.]